MLIYSWVERCVDYRPARYGRIREPVAPWEWGPAAKKPSANPGAGCGE